MSIETIKEDCATAERIIKIFKEEDGGRCRISLHFDSRGVTVHLNQKPKIKDNPYDVGEEIFLSLFKDLSSEDLSSEDLSS